MNCSLLTCTIVLLFRIKTGYTSFFRNDNQGKLYSNPYLCYLDKYVAYFKVGDKLPNVDLFDGTPQNKVNLVELVKNKKVVIFGEVGAFTPCCSKVS